MKYIVIVVSSEMEENVIVETQPILCETVGAVFDAIKESNSPTWSVWEIVNGKAERCVVFNAFDMRSISIIRKPNIKVA